MIKNWVFVYIGNFIGAMIVGAIVIFWPSGESL